MKIVLFCLSLGWFHSSVFAQSQFAQDPSVQDQQPIQLQLSKYEQVTKFLEYLHEKYPDTTEIFEVGVNDDGIPLYGIRIGKGPLKNLVVATHHGNEYGSTEVAKSFAESLAEKPILDQTIFVVPVLNVNGYNSGNRMENFHGRYVDSNRDYPGPCNNKPYFKLKSTSSLDRLIEKEEIVSAATLHTYTPAVMYPWGMSTHDFTPPHLDIWEMLVALATKFSEYPKGNSGELVYPADGTFEDYAFWRYGVWSLLFEVGRTHYPSKAAVKQMVDENVPGLRLMFESSQLKRASDHEFRGKCDLALRKLDLHLE